MLPENLNSSKLFQKNTQAAVLRFIRSCTECTNSLKHILIYKIEAIIPQLHLMLSILTCFIHFTDDHLDIKRKQSNSSIVSLFIYSIPLKLTTTDVRVYTELHKTSIIIKEISFLSGSWMWKTVEDGKPAGEKLTMLPRRDNP